MSRARKPAGRRIVVARHAKSSWDDPSLADHDRPLAPRGRKALPRMREHLDQLTFRPGLVLCSSSRRTRQTLDGVLPALGDEVVVEIDERLYGADDDDLLTRLRGVDDSFAGVLLIGHNPGVADLVDLLVDRRDSPTVGEFPTGAIAVLSFGERWQSLEPASASLESFWTPRHGDVTRATMADGNDPPPGRPA